MTRLHENTLTITHRTDVEKISNCRSKSGSQVTVTASPLAHQKATRTGDSFKVLNLLPAVSSRDMSTSTTGQRTRFCSQGTTQKSSGADTGRKISPKAPARYFSIVRIGVVRL